MAAELRLNVALDLQYFKRQLPKLSQAAAGFQLPIQIKFDRRTLQREIDNLKRSIKRKKITIEVSIAGGLDKKKFDEIQDRLNALSKREPVQIPVSIRAAASQRDITSTVAQLNRRLRGSNALSNTRGKIEIPVTIRPAITQANVRDFKKEVQDKLSGIKVKVQAEAQVSQQGGFASTSAGAAGLFEYMRTQGLSGGGGAVGVGRSERLRKLLEDMTLKQLKSLAKEQGISGVSRLNKDPLIDRLVSDLSSDVAENLLGNIKNQMKSTGPRKIKRSFLDQIARAVMYMAGIDPEVLRQQAAARRLPPAVNFPTSVPPRNISIGPSSTGRALPAGPSVAALPGTSRFAAKYLPTDLSAELKQILRGAAYAFVDAVSQRIRRVSVSEIGPARLSPARTAGLLPSAVGRPAAIYGGPGDTISRRMAQARARSNERSARIMAEGPQGFALGAGGSGGAGASGGGGRFGGGFARGAGDVFNNMSAGPIASVAKELKYATSQVLLFGTAYKALAAATALPGNIAKATANLQAFNNQMEAVTGGGEVMANSMRLIEETVARFNIPVQSARDGFVKLYASMQPAGIDLSTINSVFTGLSAAASTFGMSADQVDRMTYALAQMASKGQIMTEELKGQLGDVFPQAVSLFARAAGFLDDTMDEQAKSKGLASFLEALEDGALKGEAMSAVLSNVGKLLNTDFGPSADKAANSFQNQINKLNNALTTFYESFAPAAGAFLGEFVDPIVSALNTVGEAVKLAFSDEPLGGNQLAEYLRNELFPQLVSIKDAILAGAQTFAQFGQAASVVLRPLAQLILANQQFVNIVTRAAIVGAVLKAGLVAIRVTGIIPLIRNIVLFNKTFRVFIAQTAAGTKGMTALRAAAVQTGMGMRQAAVGVRVLATAIRTVLVSSAIGIALVAISALIEKIMQLKATAESIEAQRGGAGARIRKAAEMGGSEAMQTEQARVGGEIASRQQSIAILERVKAGKTITAKEQAQLKRTGSLPSGLSETEGGGFTAKTISMGTKGTGPQERIRGDVREVLENNRKSLAAFTEGMDKQMVAAAKNAAVVDKRFKEQSQLSLDGLDLTGGDGTGGKGGKGGKGQEDLSPEMVAIRERLREINRGLLMDQQGVNEFMQIEAELALEIQRIKESDQGTAEKIQDIEDARLEATKKKADVTKREMEKLVERLSEEESARRRIKDIMLESDLASGRITQEEYDRAKHLQSQADKLKEIARLRDEGKITPEAAGAAETSVRADVFKGDKGKVSAWIEKTEEELKDFEGMATSAADSIASEFGTAFSSILQGTTSLQEGLGNAFKNIGSMFADMVMQMLAKWAMLQVMKGIFGVAAPDAGDAMDGGGILPMFANGGIVKGPTLGMVGEGRFNEAIVPLPNGKSIPVELGGGAGSNISTNITVNVNNGQVSSKASGSQGNDLARNLEGAVKQVIMREMQPGGMISSGR